MGILIKNATMKLFAVLLGAISATEITCFECEYIWEEPENSTHINPISGKASCMHGPYNRVPILSFEESGTREEDGYEWKKRCGSAYTQGTETFFEGGAIKTRQFHMFQRHAWTFPADSPLLDAKEDFTLEEEGRHCGANRAECVGPYDKNAPNRTPCDKENECPCAKCDSVQALTDGLLTFITGDEKCKQGKSEASGACVVDDEVSGTCTIWQETIRSKDLNQIEMQTLTRSCSLDDTLPLNQWSQVDSSSQDLKLCDGLKGGLPCNDFLLFGDKNSTDTPDVSAASAVVFSVVTFISMFM